MRRKEQPGINVGGDWIIPIRQTITIWELAYVIEVSVPILRKILEIDDEVGEVGIVTANRLLRDLARMGYTDWKESSLFGAVIAGKRTIEPSGEVRLSFRGVPFARTLETRSQAPQGAVELDVDAVLARRRIAVQAAAEALRKRNLLMRSGQPL